MGIGGRADLAARPLRVVSMSRSNPKREESTAEIRPAEEREDLGQRSLGTCRARPGGDFGPVWDRHHGTAGALMRLSWTAFGSKEARVRKVLVIFAALVILPACGSDDGGTGATTAETTVTSSNGGTAATGPTATTGPKEECIDLTGEGSSFTVVLRDDVFEPSCFTASASQAITLENQGIALHSFTMKGTPIDVDVEGGDSFNGEPLAGVVAAGTYDLFCRYHQDVGMVGVVTVVK
jgi:plastocyanin